MAIQKSPDNFLDTWVGIAAIWGAITGTVALIIQLIQHFSDRSKLALQSSMRIKSDAQNPQSHLYVRVEIVNNGRRSARIEQIAVVLPETIGPLATKQFPPSELKLTSSELTLFNAEARGKFIEIPPEGGKYVFEQSDFPENVARAMFENQKEGKAYICLTSGEKLFTSFCLTNPDDLLKLRQLTADRQTSTAKQI